MKKLYCANSGRWISYMPRLIQVGELFLRSLLWNVPGVTGFGASEATGFVESTKETKSKHFTASFTFLDGLFFSLFRGMKSESLL